MSARGVSNRADALRIDVVGRGMCTYPSHSALYIIQLRGPVIFSVLDQTVIDRNGYITLLGHVRRSTPEGLLAAGRPAASMHKNQRRTQAGRRYRLIDIQQQLLSIGNTIDHIAFRLDRRTCGAECYHQTCQDQAIFHAGSVVRCSANCNCIPLQNVYTGKTVLICGSPHACHSSADASRQHDQRESQRGSDRTFRNLPEAR